MAMAGQQGRTSTVLPSFLDGVRSCAIASPEEP